MYKQYSKRGFTLIELLIVVAIIGVLAAIISIVYVNAQEKSRDSKRKADLQSVASALTLYYNDNKNYIARGGEITDASSDERGAFPVDELAQLSKQGYLSLIPADPLHKDQAGEKCQYLYYQNNSSGSPAKATNFKVASTNAEALGSGRSACRSSAGEFQNGQYSCEVLQVSSTSLAADWLIGQSSVNGNGNFSGCRLGD
jgi:type II secretion system protein G